MFCLYYLCSSIVLVIDRSCKHRELLKCCTNININVNNKCCTIWRSFLMALKESLSSILQPRQSLKQYIWWIHKMCGCWSEDDISAGPMKARLWLSFIVIGCTCHRFMQILFAGDSNLETGLWLWLWVGRVYQATATRTEIITYNSTQRIIAKTSIYFSYIFYEINIKNLVFN